MTSQTQSTEDYGDRSQLHGEQCADESVAGIGTAGAFAPCIPPTITPIAPVANATTIHERLGRVPERRVRLRVTAPARPNSCTPSA